MPRKKKIVETPVEAPVEAPAEVAVEKPAEESTEKRAYRAFIQAYREQSPAKYAQKEPYFIKKLNSL